MLNHWLSDQIADSVSEGQIQDKIVIMNKPLRNLFEKNVFVLLKLIMYILRYVMKEKESFMFINKVI